MDEYEFNERLEGLKDRHVRKCPLNGMCCCDGCLWHDDGMAYNCKFLGMIYLIAVSTAADRG